MGLSSDQLVELKTELTTNPASMPYLALDPANDQANADIINNVGNANPRTVRNATVSTDAFVGATTFGAYDGLTASETAYYDMITARETVAVTDDTIANFAAVGGTSIWATADRATMEPRMSALMQKQVSRAVELGFPHVPVVDLRDALNLP